MYSEISNLTYPIHSSAGGRLAGLQTKGDLRRCRSWAAVYCRVTMGPLSILKLQNGYFMSLRRGEGGLGSQRSGEVRLLGFESTCADEHRLWARCGGSYEAESG